MSTTEREISPRPAIANYLRARIDEEMTIESIALGTGQPMNVIRPLIHTLVSMVCVEYASDAKDTVRILKKIESYQPNQYIKKTRGAEKPVATHPQLPLDEGNLLDAITTMKREREEYREALVAIRDILNKVLGV